MNREKQKSQVIRNGSLGFLLLQRIFFCRVLDIRVPEVVEADVAQAVCLQQVAEALGELVRDDEIAQRVHADAVQPLLGASKILCKPMKWV